MSAHAMKNFMLETSSNPALASAFVAALEGKTGPDAYRAVSSFASAHGHAVTEEDARSMHADVLAMDQADGEIPDDTLDAVSGGEIVTGIALVAAAVGGGTLFAALGTTMVGRLMPGPVGNFFRSW